MPTTTRRGSRDSAAANPMGAADGGNKSKATSNGSSSSRFVDNFNQKVEQDDFKHRDKRPRESGASAATSLLSPPSDHDMYMKRASYQDIFKDVTGAAAEGARPSPLNPSTHHNHNQNQNPTDVLAAAAAQQQQLQQAAAVATMMAMAPGAGGGRKPNPPPLTMTGPGMGHQGGPSAMSPLLQAQMQQVLQLQAGQAAAAAAVAAAAQAQAVQMQQSGGGTPQSGGFGGYAAPGTPMSPPLGPGPPTPGSGATESVKKASRLWKNRLAAKECRRKKKEYVKDLETRCKELEQHNEKLMHQLAAARGTLTEEQKEDVMQQMQDQHEPGPNE